MLVDNKTNLGDICPHMITMGEPGNLLIQGYLNSNFTEDGGNVIVSGGFGDGNNGNATVFGQQVTVQAQLSLANGSPTYSWTFGADGNLVVPGDSTIKPFSGDLSLDASSGNVYIKSKGHTFNFDVPNGHARFIMPNDGEIVARSNLSITMGDWANTLTGNSWVFSEDGNLTFPTGNLTIIPDYAAFSNAAAIVSQDHNLITVSFGANGGTSSLWVEDYANIGSSNIAAVFANPVPGSGNVRIAVGTNGGPGLNLWDFQPNGNTKFPGNLALTGNLTGVGASPAPSINGFDTINAITVSASGNITGNAVIAQAIGTIPVTVGTLPPATDLKGTRAFVTDANTITFYDIVGGSGSNNVPIFSDGTDWRVG